METAKQLELGISFAAELAKQLITLASGLLVLSVTLLEKLPRPPRATQLLTSAWVLLGLSILAGVWTHMALTGALVPIPWSQITGITAKVRIPAAVQVITFAAGVLLFMPYGVLALRTRPTTGSPSPSRPGSS